MTKPVNIAQELQQIEAKLDEDIALDNQTLSALGTVNANLVLIADAINLILEALSLPEAGQAATLNLDLGTPEPN